MKKSKVNFHLEKGKEGMKMKEEGDYLFKLGSLVRHELAVPKFSFLGNTGDRKKKTFLFLLTS